MNIYKRQRAEIEGLVSVEQTQYVELSGRVRVRVTTPEKLPENWEKYGEPEPMVWGDDIGAEPEDWHYDEDEDEAESWSETEKESETWSKSDGTGAEPMDWHYPLEDSR